MSSNYSFGFSDNNKTDQFYADKYDCKLNNNLFDNCSNDKKLSWHLTGSHGGWRIGSICNLNNSTLYQKYIFLKYYNNNKQTIVQDTKARTSLTSSTTVQTSTTTTLNTGKFRDFSL
jgi:hypothetical protein